MKPSIALAPPLLSPPLLALLPLLALAACHSQPRVSATNASVAEVAAKVAAANGDRQLVSPGRWESTATVRAMTIPGLPPAQQAELAKRQGRAHKTVSCVTPEQIKANKAFIAGDGMKGCTYDHLTMSGGTIDAAMTCTREGMAMTATLNGRYSPDTYHLDMTSKAKAPAGSPMSGMTMSVSVDARRVGACKGDEDKAGVAK